MLSNPAVRLEIVTADTGKEEDVKRVCARAREVWGPCYMYDMRVRALSVIPVFYTSQCSHHRDRTKRGMIDCSSIHLSFPIIHNI